MNLTKLFIIHAFITLAAGVVLVVAPNLIPSAVGIAIEPHAYLICYLLAASEFSLAALSYGSATINDKKALRVIVTSIIILHASSGLLEIYALTQGLSAAIWGNILLRVLAVILFCYYGFYNPHVKK